MDNQNGMAVFHLIRQAYTDWCRPLCQELGMPQMALDILMFLSVNPKLCTAKDINRHQGFKKNILSVNVNKLVSEGYLERQSVEGDRRKVRLVLTEKSQPIITRGKRTQEEFHGLLREGITPEELDISPRHTAIWLCRPTPATNSTSAFSKAVLRTRYRKRYGLKVLSC